MACKQLDMSFTNTDIAVANTATTALIRRISEICLPANSAFQRELLLPMLSHLSHTNDHRWLTWVGAYHLKKAQCEEAGLNWQRLLQVITRPHTNDSLKVARKAATTGTSHTIVLLTEQRLTNDQLNELEACANTGNTQILIVCFR